MKNFKSPNNFDNFPFRKTLLIVALKPLVNEAELLKSLALGSEKAFNDLFYATHNQLAEFIFSLSKSTEITEEIVHDVFLKVWENRANAAGINNFNSYLFILTRNHTLNILRKHANTKLKQSLYEENTRQEILPSEPVEDYEILLEKAVSQLPPQQQKVFLLRQQGLKNAQVAEEMHISPASVKKYQQWALQSVVTFIKTKAAISFLLGGFFI